MNELQVTFPELPYAVEEAMNRLRINIKFCGKKGFQRPYIGTSDVPLVGTGVNRNTLCAKPFTIERKLHHVRRIAATGIAQRGYLVDIYTQSCHLSTHIRYNFYAAKVQHFS